MTGARWTTLIVVVLLLALFVWAFVMKNAQEGREMEALDEYELTPLEFRLLPENKKQHYRDRRIEVPLPQDWGGALFSTDAGSWSNVYEKAVHTGMLDPLMAQYNRAVFEMEHPRIRVRFQPWDMWSPDYRSQTLVAVQSGTAPAVSVARDWTANIKRGLYADITEIVGGQEWVENARLLEDKQWLARHPNVWTNFHRQPVLAKRVGMLNGRAFTITSQKLTGSVVAYRKDWYEWVARKLGWDKNPVGTKVGPNKVGALCGPAQHPWGIWGPHPDWRVDDFILLMKTFTENARLIAETQIDRYTPPEKMPANLEEAIEAKVLETRGFSGPMGPWAEHGNLYWIPDTAGKQTWKFVGTPNADGKRGKAYEALVKAIIDAYVIVKRNKWIATSAQHDWTRMVNDFENSKVGMINFYTHLVANGVVRNRYMFGAKTTYDRVVGMVPPPYDRYAYRDIRPDANIFNFFPSIVERKLTVRSRGRMAELRRKQLEKNAEAIIKDVLGAFKRLRLLKEDLVVDPLTGRPVSVADQPKEAMLSIAHRLEAERYPQFWLNAEGDADLIRTGADALRTVRDSLRRTLRPRTEDVVEDRTCPKETLHFTTSPDQVHRDDMVKSLRAAIAAVKAAAPSVHVVDPLSGTDPLSLDVADLEQAVLLRQIANRLAYETTPDLTRWLKSVADDQREAALKALFDGCHGMYLMAKRRDIKLRAAFDWTESHYYGRMFVERIRVSKVKADLLNEGFQLPNMLLSMPFEPRGEVKELFKTVDLAKVFPREYIESVEILKKIVEIPPLYHEFGLVDPGELVRYQTIPELYQEVLTVDTYLKGVASEAQLRERLRDPVVRAIEKYKIKINKELEDKPGEDVLAQSRKYHTAWVRFFADRPEHRQYYLEVVVPYVRTYCKGLVDLSRIRLAPVP